MLKRSLLHLLEKLIGLTDAVLERVKSNSRFHKRYAAICQILAQQKLKFEGREVKDLIVSIDKPYLHPIVRGKETKSVEFGAKVNMMHQLYRTPFILCVS